MSPWYFEAFNAPMAHIVFVDDYQPLRQALSRYLRLHSHVVTEVGSGAAALVVVQNRGADVVVTDLNLPGMDGRALIRGLRDRGVSAPTILITGEQETGCLTDETNRLLRKPFAPSDLLEAIHDVLDARDAAGEGIGSA